MKKKNVLTIVLALMLMSLTFAIAPLTVSAAAPTATCTVSVTEKNVGSDNYYVAADVTFTSNTEFTAGLFMVEAQDLTLTDCTVKDSVGGLAPEVQFEASKNKVIFTGFSNSSDNDFRSYTSLILTLKFKLNSGATSTVRKVAVKNITLANYNEVKFTTADAEGTAQTQPTHTPGDINKDGKVNNKDLTRLFQYLSDWDVEVDANAIDVNGDGKVNNKDLTRLFQYLSDWDVQIF